MSCYKSRTRVPKIRNDVNIITKEDAASGSSHEIATRKAHSTEKSPVQRLSLVQQQSASKEGVAVSPHAVPVAQPIVLQIPQVSEQQYQQQQQHYVNTQGKEGQPISLNLRLNGESENNRKKACERCYDYDRRLRSRYLTSEGLRPHTRHYNKRRSSEPRRYKSCCRHCKCFERNNHKSLKQKCAGNVSSHIHLYLTKSQEAVDSGYRLQQEPPPLNAPTFGRSSCCQLLNYPLTCQYKQGCCYNKLFQQGHCYCCNALSTMRGDYCQQGFDELAPQPYYTTVPNDAYYRVIAQPSGTFLPSTMVPALASVETPYTSMQQTYPMICA